MNFLTINQAAKHIGLPHTCLRLWLSDGNLPGCYAGTRFYVDVDALQEKISSGALSARVHAPSENTGRKKSESVKGEGTVLRFHNITVELDAYASSHRNRRVGK